MATDAYRDPSVSGGRLSVAERPPRAWAWLRSAEGRTSVGDARGVLSDEDLAVRARKDPEAFGELYERYVARIHGFVYARLRNRATAEDLTAEVFFKALRAIEQYQPGRPFRAWLFQIATNAVIDHLRRQRSVAPLEEAVDRAAGGPAVEDHALARAELADVRAALETLNEGQRTALALRLGQDLNTAEIAACMGRSEGAVKLLIHRGLRTVREHLQTLAPQAGEPS